MKSIHNILMFAAALIMVMPLMANQPDMAFFRQPDQRGLHVFETPRTDTLSYEGLKLRIGGNFTQQFQALSHENQATPNMVGETNTNALYPLTNGFNLATANLVFDVQLEDGIRMSLESYMSSRHHPEFWVKGGYIQIDKLPMLGSPQWFTDHISLRIGHMEVNYGDQHFRRSDNGRTLFNPFVGNTIMDAFATEIGGELYVHFNDEFFVMAGMTGGLINGDVKDTGIKKSPSLLAKAGYDKQINDDLRLRLSGSLYTNPGTTRNTLYAGDRAGSRYYMAVEPEFTVSGAGLSATTPANRFTSGRLTPEFTREVTSIMINPFIKFRGLEFFGIFETSSGTHNPAVEKRQFTHLSAELIYRFWEREQFFFGGRYTQVKGELPGANGDVSVDRIQLGLGWHTTRNLLVKLEYVNQNFNDFDVNDYRHKASFSGIMLEAAIAF